MKYGVVFLFIAAAIALLTALSHMSCIFLGPQCYSIQMAPPEIVESAKNGTLLAPVGAIIISAVFLVFACYALSAAKIIRRLPLLKPGIYTIASLCIIRGLLPTQLWLRHPEKVTDLVLYVGFAWLLTGLLYLCGFLNVQKLERKSFRT